jgi:ubiquinone/menaquinone biosynthesis C-methylase UbiE
MNPSDPAPGDAASPQEYIRLNFAPEAFSGTAGYYVQYRVPYPDVLLGDLIGRLNCSGDGRLLDLACGPGRVALAVASSFREIWAVDLEPDMIDAGRAEAARRGIAHVTWILGRAEDMDFADESFDAVVIGEAFHRLDQARVAAQTLRWLKPSCALVTLGSFSMLSEREPWQRIVVEAIRRWTNWRPDAALTDAARKALSGPEEYERVMRAAGFRDVATYPFAFPHAWTLDSILGYLYSTSVASKRALGTNAEAFESDLRSALLAHNPSGVYHEKTDWGYTFGRKPD